MRDNECITVLLPAVILGFVCFATVLLSSRIGVAGEFTFKPSMSPNAVEQGQQDPATAPPPATHPRNATVRRFLALRPSVRPYFTSTDKLAALESVQLALSEVADGSTYVWHRSHGNLSGIIRPTRSYFGRNREVCRELLILLSANTLNRQTKTTACRDETGIWRLNG
ncbi:MAG: hypothetical protein AAFV45_04775 [Pseudomonadota bacterium]